jgi:hypothetical protein
MFENMEIKIAVTDACIFIDLHDLGLVAKSFFNLEIEIHTTSSVYLSYTLNSKQDSESLSVC